MITTSIRSATSALLAVVVIAAPVATTAVADASPAASAAVTQRSLDLVGAPNARTLAGYTGADGRVVDDLVVRSDNLSRLTTDDLTRLRSRDVRLIVDLRTPVERALQPDRPVPGATTRVRDVLGRAPITTLIDLPAAYRAFVTDPGARSAIGATLRDIAAETTRGHRVLVHCTAGKDRTGWVAAVLLSILGVDRATVDADYLVSNASRHTTSRDPVNGVSLDWLRSSFRLVDTRYGGMDGYVREGLGLDASVTGSLRSALLAPR
ncbi:tyrosine-protein phosphatase [Williamsia deligens]|uniref:Tyrosine-protein phosphatase n=1 Tax=Williamsia deligens TaxID=321325 RepID=A0ABW3GBJ8_9NOCA|nr:tyrosine-protein phosphatase [Williamsia deligens]MCP2195460.1 protein-tyrosine phosphatase [Williamsia deligens]